MRKFLALLLFNLPCYAFAQQLFSSDNANIDVTNINAKILNGGDMFTDLYNSAFEVPRGSGKHTIFRGAIWIGGRDQQNNIYLSAVHDRNFALYGYWPGPIGTTQNSQRNAKYDKIWKVSAAQIKSHVLHYNSSGYNMPADIATWPGNGNITNGEAAHLAPYIDTNNDGIYSPGLGDYPAIKGDQALYQIINDKGNVKMPTSPSFHAEIHIMYYGFNTTLNTSVYNTLFADYRIINRSQINLQDFYAGIWTDMDLGYFNDDLVGCDTLTNRYYTYNGDNNDEGPYGYGIAPPVQSVMFLDKPMRHFLYYEANLNPTNGIPSYYISEYYNYLRGIWRDGSLLTYGGDGTNQSKKPVRYMFPGDPVTQLGWSERNRLDSPIPVTNQPGERRSFGSIGPFNLNAGQEFNFSVAFTYSRGNSNLNSITVANQDAQAVRSFYSNTVLATAKPIELERSLILSPNPAKDYLMITRPAAMSNRNLKITITDYFGKTVLTKNINTRNEKTIPVKIDNINNGIYQVKVSDGTETIISKLVKH